MRKVFLLLLVACICSVSGFFMGAEARGHYKFYITAPWIGDGHSPVVSYGGDRLEALANSGVTVWTEAEWTGVDKLLDEFKDR